MGDTHNLSLSDNPVPAPVQSRHEQLNEVATRAQMFTGGSGAAIAFKEGDVVVTQASSGANAPDVGSRSRIEGSFTGLCVRTGRAVYCEDTETDLRVDAAACRALNSRSIVVVPIKDADTVLGVLAVFSAQALGFTRTDIAVLKTMAETLSANLLGKEPVEPSVFTPVQNAQFPSIGSKTNAQQSFAPPPQFTMPTWPSVPTGRGAAPTHFDPPARVTKGDGNLAISSKRDEPALVSLAESITGLEAEPSKQDVIPPPNIKRIKQAKPSVPLVNSSLPEPYAKPPYPPKLTAASGTTVSSAVLTPPIRQTVTKSLVQKSPAAKAAEDMLLPTVHLGAYGAAQDSEGAGNRRLFIMVAVLCVGLALVGGLFLLLRNRHARPSMTSAQDAAPIGSETSPTYTATENDAVNKSAKAIEDVGRSVDVSRQKLASTTSAKPGVVPSKEQQMSIGMSQSRPRTPGEIEQPEQPPNVAVNGPGLSGIPVLSKTLLPKGPIPTKSTFVPNELVKQVPPVYPEMARRMRIGGVVVLALKVMKDGKVGNVRVVQGERIFHAAAIDAVKQWQYKPAYLDGKPVESDGEVRVNFVTRD